MLVGIGLPITFWIGEPVIEIGKVIAGHVLFFAMSLVVILMVIDAYRVTVVDAGVSRGLFDRSKVISWEDVKELQMGASIRVVGSTYSVSVFPFVFKDKADFYRYLEIQLPWLRNNSWPEYNVPHSRQKPSQS